jgi:hypothetical protein
MEIDKKICFIIACKYYRNYKSYIKYYVDNIKKFYENSYIILVDNNSLYIKDIIDTLKDYKNIEIIINNSECKFEIGAYNEGIRYIQNNSFLKEYDYFVFSQDTFILNNKYDFNELYNNNIFACSFNHFNNIPHDSNLNIYDPICIKILQKINIYDKLNEFNLCWCCSFILHSSKINDYYNIVKDEIITTRHGGSTQSERYLSGIMYYLNNNNYVSICGDMSSPQVLGYDCWNVNIENNDLSNYFIKTVQQKSENTVDI